MEKQLKFDNLVELSNRYDSLNMPFAICENINFQLAIKNIFDEYNSFLSDLKELNIIEEDLINSIRNIENSLNSILDDYSKGNSYENYSCLEGIFQDELYDELSHLVYKVSPELNLYRARISNDVLYDRKEMFHIPFSKRYLVDKYRFSIAGYPCLYLASSSYVCWLELNRPNIANMWLSLFKTTESLRVLDLAFDLKILLEQLSKEDINIDVFKRKLKLYPIVLASCFRTKYPQGKFHEEYIIPVLLLGLSKNWRHIEWDGIRYITTRSQFISYECLDKLCSYVFLPKSNVFKSEFDKYISEKFELTNPQHWTGLTALPNAGDVIAYSSFSGKSLDEIIITNYSYTSFYNADKHLENIEKGHVINS